MKKIFPIFMAVLVMGAMMSCNKKGNKGLDAVNDSISMKAGEMLGAQLNGMLLGDSATRANIDIDEFYDGFASVFSCDSTKAGMSYISGTQMAARAISMLTQMGIDVNSIDRGLFLVEFKKMLANTDTAKVGTDRLSELDKSLGALIESARVKKGELNKKAGAEYMKKRAKEKGFVTTKSGIMYRVIKPGNGATFGANDTIDVVYEGKLIDGKTFDSSQGQARPFPVTAVVPGFAEMLQLMKPGMQVEVIIPGELAYGPDGQPGTIGPNETLIFTMETKGKSAPRPAMPGMPGNIQVVPAQ